MKIEHLAIWVHDLEKMKAFYEVYFGAVANQKYHNPAKHFESYFLNFNGGCRLELMRKTNLTDVTEKDHTSFSGLAHFAFSVGSREQVDSLTEKFRQDGFQVIGEPRVTGDGYYESVILDPENNMIEITV